VPAHHWRSYGTDPLPSGAAALDEPFSAFPPWFLRITCDRCGKARMLNEAHTPQRNLLIRDLIAKMRRDGCGGRPGRVELLTGIVFSIGARDQAGAVQPSTTIRHPGRLSALDVTSVPDITRLLAWRASTWSSYSVRRKWPHGSTAAPRTTPPQIGSSQPPTHG
jgi:hypothetical protein